PTALITRLTSSTLDGLEAIHALKSAIEGCKTDRLPGISRRRRTDELHGRFRLRRNPLPFILIEIADMVFHLLRSVLLLSLPPISHNCDDSTRMYDMIKD